MRTFLDSHPVGVLIIFSRLFAAPRYNVLPMVQSRANVNLQRSEAVPHRAHTMSSQLYPTVFAEHNHSARTYFPATVNFSPGVRVCPFQIFGTSGLERLENATFGPGSAQGKRKRYDDAHFADRIRGTPAP